MEISIKPKIYNFIFIVLLLIMVPACELFLPFPENEELKLDAILLASPENESTISLGYSDGIKFYWTNIDENKDYKVVYEFYLSENPSPGLIETDLTSNNYYLKLAKNKTYYWKVIAKLDGKAAESEVWSFRTE